MGNFFEKMQEDKKEAKEAAEAKANEYAALSARVDRLEKAIEGLERTIGGLEKSLQGITPQRIESIQRAGEKVFEPLKQAAADLNKEIKAASGEAVGVVRSAAGKLQAAGNEAVRRISEAGERTWQELAIEGVAIALFFTLINMGLWWFMGLHEIKKDVDYNRNRIDAIHWNQTTGTTNGARKYSPWEMQDFYKAWDNQQTYIINKQREEAAKCQELGLDYTEARAAFEQDKSLDTLQNEVKTQEKEEEKEIVLEM